MPSSSMEQLTYIKTIKEMILADAWALYSARGFTSAENTLDIITSQQGGAYQATVILYHDLRLDTHWMPLVSGLRCTNTAAALKMLWAKVQMEAGIMLATGHQTSMPLTPSSTTFGTPTMAMSGEEATTSTTPAETRTRVSSANSEAPSPMDEETEHA